LTPFQELDEYLAQEFSMNYWADDAIDYAYELFQRMQPADWNSLKSYWRTRPKQWQYRCADALSGADPWRAAPLLLEMIQDPDDDLAQQAADTLNALDVDKSALEVSPKIVERLKALARTRHDLDVETIKELLGRLSVKS
jgi:hypothetical protein